MNLRCLSRMNNSLQGVQQSVNVPNYSKQHDRSEDNPRLMGSALISGTLVITEGEREWKFEIYILLFFLE